jgi:hypothetical protein
LLRLRSLPSTVPRSSMTAFFELFCSMSPPMPALTVSS